MDSNATTFFYQALVGCSPEADQAFGPIVAVECRQGFDFTLYFEQSILSIVPSVILLALFPIRFYKLYRSSVKTVPDSLHGVKAVRPHLKILPRREFDSRRVAHSYADNRSIFCTHPARSPDTMGYPELRSNSSFATFRRSVLHRRAGRFCPILL